MRFLVNANFGPSVVNALQEMGYDAVSVDDQFGPGYPDELVLDFAVTNDYVIVTKDSDFGEMVFHRHMSHAGVIYIREEDESAAIAMIREFLEQGNDSQGQFIRLKR